MTQVYEARPIKRVRRSNSELAELDELLLEIVAEENPVTVRRVFYSATTKTELVDKSEAGYSLVQRRVLELRRTDRMPYWWIGDNTRYIVEPFGYRSVEDALRSTASIYRRMLWDDQPQRVQVFTEKDALVSVIEPVTDQWQVPLGVMRGCASESFIWKVGQSVARIPVPTYFYQLGDHDPTGVMAWEKFEEGVRRFAPDAALHFERVAVTLEQIDTMGLPTRPTKTSDSRSKGFEGDSVEVDAIPAPVLRDLIADAIRQHVNPLALDATEQMERSEKSLLQKLAGGELA